MNNPFLFSSTRQDVPFLPYKREVESESIPLFSITDTVIKYLIDETKAFTQLLQEWVKLSGMLVNPSVTEGYLSQWRWMNDLITEGVKRTVALYEGAELKQRTDLLDADENDRKGKQRRILVLTWEFPPHIVGGLSRHVHGLTKALAKKGHEIHVITAGAGDSPVMEKINGVSIHRVKPLSENEEDFLLWIGGLNIALAEKAAALAEEYSFDCIHSHDWLVGAAAVSLKKHLQLPLVTTIHATEYGRNNGIYTEMQRFIHQKEKQLVEQSDQVVVCSDFMKGEVQKLFSAEEKKLVTIPNGIDCDGSEVLNRDLSDVKIDRDCRMIFSIGRMVKEKGFDTLIEAAAALKAKRINVYFIIAGKGPMLEEYRRRVIEMQLTDRVRFIGFIDEEKRNALLQLAEIAIFPSLYEPFGIVALEAMQAGKPTIVSNTGGLKGIIQHLETGMLIEPAGENIVEGIITLLEDPDLAERIGKKGKELVLSRYNWDIAALETVKLYDHILNAKKHHHLSASFLKSH
ncbi:glycosyltransferase family 4 protein [Bacillus tuaregi]|uniref:glycosyltransferase family 4 protein n=1 Tax=Bacillus tuaregi TaxID=1816695 RepID=UPI000A558EEC|nr:glycosyltransferase family 4 protein [Bacillus tuaregi]